MRTLVGFFVSVLTIAAAAQSPSVSPTPAGSPAAAAAAEPKRREIPIEHLMTHPAELDTDVRTEVETFCTTSDGKTIAKGARGYDSCLTAAAAAAARNNAHSQTNNTGVHPPGARHEVGAGTGVKVKIGK